MKYLLTTLTVVNAAMFVCSLAQPRRAAADIVGPMIRTRGLEIVDEQGRVRAELKVMPADPNVKMPDGSKGYPESVLLRLISSKGAPNVKLTTTEDGSGLVLGGDSAYVQVLSRGASPFLKIVNKD